MHDWQSLSHVRWDCKYHVVIVPKYRKKVIYGRLKHRVEPILRQLLHERRMTGLSFWATGDCVSTVGLDEEAIRRYTQEQEQIEFGQGELDLK